MCKSNCCRICNFKLLKNGLDQGKCYKNGKMIKCIRVITFGNGLRYEHNHPCSYCNYDSNCENFMEKLK
jgi:hypothetical protein